MRRVAAEPGWLHRLFEASLAAKCVFAGIETLAGLGLLLAPAGAMAAAIGWLAERELVEAATGPVAARFLRAAQGFTADTQHFYALYLLGHGVLKLVMVAMLWLRIRAAYPASLVVLAGFIAYQLHRWSVTHGPLMLALSLFDLLVMWLVWREWQAAAG